MRRLTYCTNIHPGESWADARANLEAHLLGVKAAVAPEVPFPIGLRLSGQAVAEIDDAEARRFQAWCEENGTYVLTVNGFPHGRFHGVSVKEKVYDPDWRDPVRAKYTNAIADRLVQWLPGDAPGSISTVPIAWAPSFQEADWPAVRANVLTVVDHLDALAQSSGKALILAFEPEPGCVVETTSQAIELFERLALPQDRVRYAGLCYDCCHQAVQFEDPIDSFGRIEAAGIPIGKIQVSSSLRARGDEIPNLRAFDEPTYLHQVVARDVDGGLHRASDLPVFFGEGGGASDGPALEECRVHFHVPIFADHLGPCGTTRFFLEELLPRIDPGIALEVETYSFDVLPAELRTDSVTESLARELIWAEQRCHASNRRT